MNEDWINKWVVHFDRESVRMVRSNTQTEKV
jgi:hypothetical protein